MRFLIYLNLLEFTTILKKKTHHSWTDGRSDGWTDGQILIEMRGRIEKEGRVSRWSDGQSWRYGGGAVRQTECGQTDGEKEKVVYKVTDS